MKYRCTSHYTIQVPTLQAMEIEPVGGVSTAPTRALQPAGVTAELAQARAKLRESAPPDQWDAVMDEVRRLQIEESMPPLAAMQQVYARLAAGWVPAPLRWRTLD